MARRRRNNQRTRDGQAGNGSSVQQPTREDTDWSASTAVNEEANALHEAAAEGDEYRVEELLDKGINCNARSNDPRFSGQTPLLLAAQNGHVYIVELLLNHDGINPDCKDSNGQTPLSLAAGSGDTVMVNSLLVMDEVDPDSRDNQGLSPLFYAAEAGHDDVVRELCTDTRVNPNIRDSHGRTPLLAAALKGHEGVLVELLAQKHVDPDPKDDDGRTLILYAAEKGDDDTVRDLLGRKRINPNIRDSQGRTPLLLAALGGQNRVVEELLENENHDIDPDPKDSQGLTPLLHAAKAGHYLSAGALLQDKRVNPNTRDGHGRTPLLLVAMGGYDGLLAKLLERADIDSNAEDYDGMTALLYAASCGYEYCVALLIQQRGVNSNSKDKDGRTAISLASQNGHTQVIPVILWATGVDQNSKDKDGITPLLHAARNRHKDIVNLLLENPNVDQDAEDSSGRTALAFALENNDASMMQTLLQGSSRSLHSLIESGEQRAVEMALDGQCNTNAVDNLGRTPLHIAVGFGHSEIAKMLVDSGADVNSKDCYGTTCLHLAIRRKNRDITDLLLQSGAHADGVTASNWFEAYGEKRPDIMGLSESATGAKCVRFFNHDRLQTELANNSTDMKAKRHLMLFSDYSAWQEGQIPDSSYPLQRNKLRISETKQTSGPAVSFTVGIWFPTGPDPTAKGHFKVAGWEGYGITWTAVPPVGSNYAPSWQTVDHFSTLPYGWIPEDGIQFVILFIGYLEQRWLKLCDYIEMHLAECRAEQLVRKGEDIELIPSLARDAQQLTEFRRNLRDQVRTAREFGEEYCRRYNGDRGLDAVKRAVETFSKKADDQINQLDQTVRDLLQFEFAWVSVNEAHKSTSIARSMKRISWVTLVFLPPMFISSIFGMNVNALENNPDWRWYILFTTVTLLLTFSAFVLFKHAPIERWLEARFKQMQKSKTESQQPTWNEEKLHSPGDSKV